MDDRLHERLSKWHTQIDAVGAAEKVCLELEANEKPLWFSLFLQAEGKNVTEREGKAYTSETWREFQSGLVAAKVELNKQKRLLELKQSAFQAEYLAAKTEGSAIQSFPRIG